MAHCPPEVSASPSCLLPVALSWKRLYINYGEKTSQKGNLCLFNLCTAIGYQQHACRFSTSALCGGVDLHEYIC